MTPAEAAHELHEELEAALEDLAGESATARVLAVEPPKDLGADTSFLIRLRASPGHPPAEHRFPTPLVMGYLADEEAAVDEWRHRIHVLSRSVGG